MVEQYKDLSDFNAALKVYNKIFEAHFEVYFAGGCVRDYLLKRRPKDFDIASSARPEQIQQLFEKVIPIGQKFGVMIVVQDGIEIEVTSFRSDLSYEDGRHPREIKFSTKEEDAQRRDLTINGLFYDINKGEILDFVSGQKDIHEQIIRAIGEPKLRFEEDKLRILRAVRFACELDFKIEEKTFTEIKFLSYKIVEVSAERVTDEFNKIWKSDFIYSKFDLLFDSGILQNILSERKIPENIFNVIKVNEQVRLFDFISKQLCLDTFQNKKSDEIKIDLHCLLYLSVEIENWILFWYEFVRLNQIKKIEIFDSLLRKFRFSNDWIKIFKNAVFWWISEKRDTEALLIGEFIEKFFEIGSATGFILHSFYDKEFNNLFLRSFKIWLSYEGVKPQPILTAKTLSLYFSGKDLGTNLKKVYWRQLEGLVKTEADGLEFLGINPEVK